MYTRILYTLLLTLLMCSCQVRTNANVNSSPIHINRFDKELFSMLAETDTSNQNLFIQKTLPMMTILGKGVLNMQSVESKGFLEKMKAYYSEPTLHKLYQDALTQYQDVSSIEKQLTEAFDLIHSYFPDKTIPAFYMHVSGFNQNVLVGDSVISISIDKYMGENYPLYQEFFYDFQRRKMTQDYIVEDYIAGWLMSEFPFDGKENVLLDRMIYEGKIKYMVHSLINNVAENQIIGYTPEQEQWCRDNEKELWAYIIEKKQLYTPDLMATDKYFEEKPGLFISDKAPGNLGIWLGLQIVNQYMKENPVTPKALMENNDSQQILTLSKFKP